MTNSTIRDSEWRSAQTVADPNRISRDDVLRASGALAWAQRLLSGEYANDARMRLASGLQRMFPGRCLAAGHGLDPLS
jgi:hypothetical protein